MRAEEARELGRRVASRVADEGVSAAYCLLAPHLAQRIPFPVLGEIGHALGAAPMPGAPEVRNAFLDLVAGHKTMGGWVIIGCALEQQLGRDLPGTLQQCRGYIELADVWYATDILSERVPGPALVEHFDAAVEDMALWREAPCRWVRRAVGVAVHFWAKRAKGAAARTGQAEALLAFLEPLFGEWEMDAVKGVGWRLKTLGKYYPNQVADWLCHEIVPHDRRHRALMLRKALTHLDEQQRASALEKAPG